jgi:hypothetical protein
MVGNEITCLAAAVAVFLQAMVVCGALGVIVAVAAALYRGDRR